MAVVLSNDTPVKKQASDTAKRYNRGAMFSGVALSFNGTSAVIDFGDLGADVKTLSVAIKPTTDTEKIIDLDGGTHVLEVVSGVITATGFDSPTIYIDGYPGTNIEINKWSIITVTTETGIDANALKVGQSSTNYYDGELSNIILYDVVLSAPNVERIFLDPSKPNPTGIGQNNIIAWWPLVENNSSINYCFDYSGNNHNAAITAATPTTKHPSPVLQTSTIGQSLKSFFDGTDDAIDIGSVSATDEITVSAWILTSTFAKYILVFGDTYLYLINSTTIRWNSASGSNVDFTVSEMSGKLTHVLVTQSSTTANIYINGVFVSSATASAITTNTISSYIGRRSTTYFNGFIDEVGVISEAITPEAVAKIYNSGKPHNLLNDSGAYSSSEKLLGYWTNGDWVEKSGNGNTATVAGSPEYFLTVKGFNNRNGLGSVLSESSTHGCFRDSEFVAIPHNKNFEVSTAISIEAWIKPFDLSATGDIVSKDLAFKMRLTSAGAVGFYFYQSSTERNLFTDNSLITIDQWYFISITYNGSTRKIYIDSVLVKEDTSVTGSMDANSNEIIIGAEDNTPSWSINAAIDEVRIYSAELSESQIINNYRAGLQLHV